MADAEWTVPTGDPVEAMKYALESIQRYGLDTLSGRTDGPADVKWHRDGVNEMTKRARLGLEAAAAAPQPAASDVPHDVVRALEKLIAHLDQCPRREIGAGGMTIDAQIRRTRISGVDAWEVEEAREALATPAPSTSTEEALRAENARLRGALTGVLGAMAFARLRFIQQEYPDSPYFPAAVKKIDEAAKTALSALSALPR